MIVLIAIAVLCTWAFLLAALHRHLKRHFSLFERLNIPGPKPSFFVGNLREIMSKGQFQATVDWGDKYGRVFGYYEGYTPVLSVSDPKILREILVKDATNFNHRKPFPLAPRKSLGLFLENGAQWRRSRNLLTPAFSAGKLKQMMPIMKSSAEVLVEELGRRVTTEPEVDIYDVFQCLTLDVIGRCAFGLQTKAQTDSQDEFLTHIRSLFKTMSTTFILPLVMAFPFLSHFVFALKNVVFLFGMNPVVWLRLKLKEVITIRKEMGPNSHVVDLLQLMLFPSPSRRNSELFDSFHNPFRRNSDFGNLFPSRNNDGSFPFPRNSRRGSDGNFLSPSAVNSRRGSEGSFLFPKSNFRRGSEGSFLSPRLGSRRSSEGSCQIPSINISHADSEDVELDAMPDLLPLNMPRRNSAFNETFPTLFGKDSTDSGSVDDLSFNGVSKHMTDREIVAQSMTFLLAGYETTSAVMAFLSRMLAEHPEVQRRLHDEIDNLEGQDVTYDNISQLSYFDMVFDEVCRLFPTASQIVTRQATEARTFNGVEIPAGMNIHANIWALHHDPEFWPQPDVFDPERFSAENKEKITGYTYLPFGAGPRKCIGMRFAMVETKVAVVKVLKEFSFSLDDPHKAHMELIGRGAIVPKNEVMVKVTKRTPQRGNNMTCHG